MLRGEAEEAVCHKDSQRPVACLSSEVEVVERHSWWPPEEVSVLPFITKEVRARTNCDNVFMVSMDRLCCRRLGVVEKMVHVCLSLSVSSKVAMATACFQL